MKKTTEKAEKKEINQNQSKKIRWFKLDEKW